MCRFWWQVLQGKDQFEDNDWGAIFSSLFAAGLITVAFTVGRGISAGEVGVGWMMFGPVGAPAARSTGYCLPPESCSARCWVAIPFPDCRLRLDTIAPSLRTMDLLFAAARRCGSFSSETGSYLLGFFGFGYRHYRI